MGSSKLIRKLRSFPESNLLHKYKDKFEEKVTQRRKTIAQDRWKRRRSGQLSISSKLFAETFEEILAKQNCEEQQYEIKINGQAVRHM